MATIQDLREAVKSGDNEEIHSLYDKLIKDLAQKHDWQTVQGMDEIVRGVAFWYA